MLYFVKFSQVRMLFTQCWSFQTENKFSGFFLFLPSCFHKCSFIQLLICFHVVQYFMIFKIKLGWNLKSKSLNAKTKQNIKQYG